MKIFKNCWGQISAHECYYGAHLFDENTASIYVNSCLDVSDELRPNFSLKNKDGFVGHCLLVFHGVKRFNLKVTPYRHENNKTVWHQSISSNYAGAPKGPTSVFYLGGSFQGMKTSVDIEIEAEYFELHILDKDENELRIV